jgi:hypothetical protein
MHQEQFIKPGVRFNKVSFYIVAHADDWQLFMCPYVYKDIVAPDCKVVFIITTAGDSGMGEKFWHAREEGLKSSIRFCIAPLSAPSEFDAEREFNNYTISFCEINNTNTYFLRLPDGNLDGNGFSASNFQSLSQFKSGQIKVISAIDNSTTYQGWSQLVSLIESVIVLESRGLSNVWIHYINPELVKNPNDHPDHIATGNLIQNISIITRMHQLLFIGYSSIEQGDILTLPDLFWKTGMFAAYEKSVYDNSGYSTLAENPELYFKLCFRKPDVTTVQPVD